MILFHTQSVTAKESADRMVFFQDRCEVSTKDWFACGDRNRWACSCIFKSSWIVRTNKTSVAELFKKGKRQGEPSLLNTGQETGTGVMILSIGKRLLVWDTMYNTFRGKTDWLVMSL